MLSIMLCTNWYVRALSLITSGCQKAQNPAGRRSDGHGIELQNRYSVCGTMVHVVVFSTHEIERNI